MKKLFFLIGVMSLLLSEELQAQGSVLDDYSHIIVPISFKFQDSDNEFQLSSLVRHTFKEEGFNTFMSEERLPMEYYEKPCEGLVVNLIKERNMLRTLIFIQLKDCRGNIVFQSEGGKSKEKDTRKALHEAFKNAFKSVEDESLKSLFEKRKQPNREMAPKKLTREEQKAQFAEVVRTQSDKFRYAGTNYLVFNRDGSYELYNENGTQKLADLKKADGKTYLYHSEEINGVANFDDDGNIVVQYMDEVLNEIESFTYKKVN